MPQKKKRKYTFRKGQTIPYESGSLMHQSVKAERTLSRALSTRSKRARRK